MRQTTKMTTSVKGFDFDPNSCIIMVQKALNQLMYLMIQTSNVANQTYTEGSPAASHIILNVLFSILSLQCNTRFRFLPFTHIYPAPIKSVWPTKTPYLAEQYGRPAANETPLATNHRSALIGLVTLHQATKPLLYELSSRLVSNHSTLSILKPLNSRAKYYFGGSPLYTPNMAIQVFIHPWPIGPGVSLVIP